MTSVAPQETRGNPLDAFVWVDYGNGGVNKRNNIWRLDRVHAAGKSEQYVTWGRFDDSLPLYVREHRNKAGRPSLERYPGQVWAEFLPLDFDCQAEPGRALVWARQVAERLVGWGADLEAIGCYFSGNRGFHLEPPAALFGGFAPSPDLHRAIKRLATTILGDISFDTSVYDKTRLWRVADTKNAKGGLYKVRLTPSEFLGLDIEGIRALAAAPRADLSPLAPATPVAALVALWQQALTIQETATTEAEARPRAPRPPAPEAREDADRDRQTVAAIAEHWPTGGQDAGQAAGRHEYVLAVGGVLAARAGHQLAFELLLGAAEEAGDASFLERDWEAEIQRAVDGAAARLEEGGPVWGLPTLDRLAPGLADRLTALWPDNPIETDRPAPPPGAPPDPAGAAGVDRFKLTDTGNAERLLGRHGAHLRYCPRWGKWLAWDERRWALDYDACRVRRFARETARRFTLWAAKRFPHEDVSDLAKAVRKHASYSESGRGINAMVSLAETFPELWVAPDQLDADPWRINCANGTIDLLTGQLGPHRPADLMTLIAPVDYDPKATAPQWEKFITEVTATGAGADDEEMATYLQRALGHGLTGDVSEQSVYFAYGAGDNGKSTLLNTVRGVLGEYAMQATEDLLMVKRGEQHPTERADLYRKRLVVSTEVEDGRRLAEALVKQLTGGENIRARRMREDHWEFAPTHKVWVGANHMPEIRGTDWAIWRRIRVMPFESRFYEPGQAPPGQKDRVKDKQLPEKLKTESAGILAWLVQGCLAWKREGLTVPQRVQEATKGYREAMDVLGEFIAERCDVEADAKALATPLYRAYVGWCEVGGEKPESQRRFGLRLKERGFTNDSKATGGYAQWKGLKLKPIAENAGRDGDIGLKAGGASRWGGES